MRPLLPLPPAYEHGQKWPHREKEPIQCLHHRQGSGKAGQASGEAPACKALPNFREGCSPGDEASVGEANVKACHGRGLGEIGTRVWPVGCNIDEVEVFRA